MQSRVRTRCLGRTARWYLNRHEAIATATQIDMRT
jgi:hypothetical protein